MAYSYGLGRVNSHIDRLHSHAKRLGGLVERHKETIACIVEHAAFQAEGMAAGALAALADHYLGTNNAPATIVGLPAVGLAGLAVGGVSLALGSHSAAGHAAAVAATWEGIGVYNLVGSALASMSQG